ncbi:MAG TPA: hypothetical protein DCZ71_02130 [Ruminococcus sp.]|nr:hypothetical protein [Ruminococcus sp.]
MVLAMATVGAVLLTILKIIGWILLAVLILLLVLMILPLRAEVSFIAEKFTYKVKLWFIPVMDSSGGGIMGWLKKRKKSGEDEEDQPADDVPAVKPELVKPETGASDAQPTITETVQENAAAEAPPEAPAAKEETAVSPESDPFDEAEEVPEKKKRHKKEKPPKEPKTLGEKVEFLLDLWRAADRPLLRIFKGIRLYDLHIDFIIADEDAYKCALNYGRISSVVYPLLGWLSTLFTVRLKTVDVNAGFAVEKSRWDAAVKVSFRLGTVVIAGLWFLVTYIFRYFIPGKLRDRKVKKAARQK